MKTPEEIKKGLYHCGTLDVGCAGCPYDEDCHTQGAGSCSVEVDALAYIQQLESDNESKQKRIEELESRLAQAERERDAIKHDLLIDPCEACKHGSTAMNDCDTLELCKWQWRGVCEENTKEG